MCSNCLKLNQYHFYSMNLEKGRFIMLCFEMIFFKNKVTIAIWQKLCRPPRAQISKGFRVFLCAVKGESEHHQVAGFLSATREIEHLLR